MQYILTDDRGKVLEVSPDFQQVQRVGRGFAKLGQPVTIHWNGLPRLFSDMKTGKPIWRNYRKGDLRP